MHHLFVIKLNSVEVKSLYSWFILGLMSVGTTVKEISIYDGEFNDRRK